MPKKGFTGHKHTERSKRLISKAIKGMKHSPEAIEKQRLGNIGQKRTQQTRDNISRAMTGRKLTEETRKRMSVAQRKRLHSGNSEKS
ncbi:MAG: NUMOD3 domain-containing DNA-binding protein [Nitrososphaeraceae archaeon]